MGASTVFGIDFNPTVDRVRVVNSAGQNFRMNPEQRRLRRRQRDGRARRWTARSTARPPLQETAYTNNSANVTLTTQYGIDSTTDALCIQNPPNNGTQTLCQPLSSLVETCSASIFRRVSRSRPRTAPLASVAVTASPCAARPDRHRRISLTRRSDAGGSISAAGVVGIAVLQPLATSIVALSADGTQLIRFLSAMPGTATTVAIAGVTAGETLVGIDYRAQTGQLFASVSMTQRQRHGVRHRSAIGRGDGGRHHGGQVAFVDGSGTPVDLPAAASGYGFDFNPTVDRIRVVTDSGLNFRLNPVNGTAVDGNLNNTAAPPAGTNTDGPSMLPPA